MTGRWIFGYGSLVWRPALPFLDRRDAFIRGYTRRFWQGSTDHRGVPGSPGRVVTLVPETDAVCWGRAYLVSRDEEETVLERLDHREKGGYERLELRLTFAGDDDASVEALVYVATAANENYLGPASLEEIAAQVRRSTGPSGDNVEYVLELARALREMNAEDEHVFALAHLVREGVDG